MSNKVLTDIMDAGNFDAGTKARNDTLDILKSVGFEPVIMFNRTHNNVFRMLEAMGAILRLKKTGRDTEYILLQYPYHTAIMKMFLSAFGKLKKKYGTKLIILIHDVVYLRDEVHQQANDRDTMEREISFLNRADRVIVHNSAMKEKLKKDGVVVPMVELGIFDYLGDEGKAVNQPQGRVQVVFAGNLKPEKSAFLYEAKKDLGVDFHLYGSKPKELESCFHYKGSYPPDQLIGRLEGNYGLIWDGNSIETCNGMYGEYLRYNDPHKFSLYIAAELPVVVWEKSALAEYVKRKGIGRTIGSFYELKDLPVAESEEYEQMRTNVKILAREIKKGEMLKKAVALCMEDKDG